MLDGLFPDVAQLAGFEPAENLSILDGLANQWFKPTHPKLRIVLGNLPNTVI